MRDADHFSQAKSFFFISATAQCLIEESTTAMSNTTDKARFFLEKSVPELKEFEKKKIFSKVCVSPLSSSRDQMKQNDQRVCVFVFSIGGDHIDHQEAVRL